MDKQIYQAKSEIPHYQCEGMTQTPQGERRLIENVVFDLLKTLPIEKIKELFNVEIINPQDENFWKNFHDKVMSDRDELKKESYYREMQFRQVVQINASITI